MNDKNSGGSSIDLRLTFDATGETPRRPASQIAGLIRQFIAIEMDLANVRVEVTESHLNYVEPYEAEREAAKDKDERDSGLPVCQCSHAHALCQADCHGWGKTYGAPDVMNGALLAWGNPAKDGSN